MADSDARAKAAKLKAKARRRRKRKAQEQELADKTPDTDAREAAKSKRRKLQEKGKKAGKSVAGTLKDKASNVTDTATGDTDDELEEASEETQESRAETFKRGLSKIGNRLGSGAAAFAEQAKEYEPQAAEGPGDEGENDAAAVATLAGAGFGGPGDPAVLVGVDENQDGQIQQDELGFLGPPQEGQPQVPVDGGGEPEVRAEAGDQGAEPMLPSFGMASEPQMPMLGGPGPDAGVFGDADMGDPMLPGFAELDDGDGEFATPYADGFVNRDGPRF